MQGNTNSTPATRQPICKPTFFLGVDVSKATLDCVLLDASGQSLLGETISNKPAACVKLLNKVLTLTGAQSDELLVCCEHTGIYSAYLVSSTRLLGIECWQADAYTISQSHGLIVRRKDDRYDASLIAAYAARFYDLRFQTTADERANNQAALAASDKLAILVSTREQVLKALTSLRNQLTELQNFDFGPNVANDQVATDPILQDYQQNQQELIQQLETKLAELDKLIARALEAEAIAVKTQMALSCPSVGIGLVARLVIVTRGFTRMTNAKQLACHAGIAPFGRSSGTSLKAKARVNSRGDRKLKTALHLSALSSVRKTGAHRAYYQKMLDRGKPKMSALNAVRNKILHIVIACIKKTTTYDKNYASNWGKHLHTS